MTDVLTPISAAAASPLAQHVIPCPDCGQAAAVHVSLDGLDPVAVRVVCAAGCSDSDGLRMAAIDTIYPIAAIA